MRKAKLRFTVLAGAANPPRCTTGLDTAEFPVPSQWRGTCLADNAFAAVGRSARQAPQSTRRRVRDFKPSPGQELRRRLDLAAWLRLGQRERRQKLIHAPTPTATKRVSFSVIWGFFWFRYGPW
jgi:hypothetical protein